MVGAVEDGGGDAAEVAVEAASRNQNKRAPGVVPNIRIFPKASGKGVICIIAGGKVLFSVQNPQHVLGRIFTSRNLQNNERLTSSAKVIQVTISRKFKIYCMITNQKYMLVLIMKLMHTMF